MKKLMFAGATVLMLCSQTNADAQSYSHTVQAERLDRGLVALPAKTGVFVSWRSLLTDSPAMTFDLYRNGQKLNDQPISRMTNYSDADGAAGDTYEVRCSVDGALVDSQTRVAWSDQYLRVHLDRPEGGTVPAGGKESDPVYTYTPDDVMVGDVDGDGEYELFVKWFPTNQADNSFRRYTGNTLIDCYKLDGTKLWRIDLGINIRSGNHYTQPMVWDFDGDGKAEMIVKTAPGTIDGTGHYVVLGNDDPNADYRSSGTNSGIVLSGPEYLTVFDGATGAEIHTIEYNPKRSILSSSAWGDSYGNRCERYLACVAYLDGEHPSAVMCRGYYTAAYLWAVDFDGKKLKERWLHASTTKGKGAYGEGAHCISVGDVDADGYDEIVYGAASIDHDGSLLYRTGFGHGDALHLAAMLPERGGLQIFMPHEEKGSAYKWDAELRDALTGEVLFGNPQSGVDNGRGLAANVTAKHSGYEYWSSAYGQPQNHGEDVGTKKPDVNFRIYWDGDLLDELFDGRYDSSTGHSAPRITKPNSDMTGSTQLMAFRPYSTAGSCNTTKATPNLQADILGDWREEVILHDETTQSDLLIFTTTIPTSYKVTCLMQDRQYREAIAWQNVAYNQPPHLSYNLEEAFNTAGVIKVTDGTPNQVVNVGESMLPVRFTVQRATGIRVAEAPEWLKVDFDAETLEGVISGKPVEEGEYKYVIETTGSEDGQEGALEGRIVAHRNQSLTLMAHYGFDMVGETTPNSVFGEAMATKGMGDEVDGKVGNALALDGNTYYTQDQYDQLTFGDSDFTIEMWVRTSDTGAYILHKGCLFSDTKGHTGNWIGVEVKDGNLKFAIDDDVTKSDVTVGGVSQWLDNEWHHMVFVRDTYAKMLYVYVDGNMVGETSDNTGAVNPTEPLVIGNVFYEFNNYFTGDIDELSIFKGAMSAAKVRERFETTGKDLAYFPMDDLSDVTTNLVYGAATVQGSGLELVDGLKNGAIKFNDNGWLQQDAYETMQVGEQDFTIEMWMQSTDADGYIFFKGSHARNATTGTTGHWIGLERKNGYLSFTIDDDVVKTDCKLTDASAVFDGKWHHVAAVRSYADKTMRLYVDGEEVVSINNVTTGAIADNMEPMMIGNSDEGTRQFAGVIDELAIHPRALSAQDVYDSYSMLAGAGIGGILIDVDPCTHYTVVDAMTGMIVRQAIGVKRTDVVDGLQRGVYILVVEDGRTMQTFKFVR